MGTLLVNKVIHQPMYISDNSTNYHILHFIDFKLHSKFDRHHIGGSPHCFKETFDGKKV